MAWLVRCTRTLGFASIVLAVMAVAHGAQAANIDSVNIFRSNVFVQTGNGASLVNGGSFFAANLASAHPNDFASVQLTYPPGTTVPLTTSDNLNFGYGSPLFANQAAMDAAFPMGVYTFTTDTAESASLDYEADLYPTGVPYLTGTDFSDLQGFNPLLPFTFHFSPYPTDAGADFQLEFFTLFDQTTSTPVLLPGSGFLPNTNTSYSIAANTLQPNHAYSYELIYSNRVILDGEHPGANFPPQIGFDLRTSGRFETGDAVAIPEPPAAALLLIAALALAVARRATGRPPRRR